MRPNDYTGTVNGRFVDAPSSDALGGTILSADLFNSLTFEIQNVLKSVAIAPDKAKEDQLAEAIRILINRKSESLDIKSFSITRRNVRFPIVGETNDGTAFEVKGNLATSSVAGSKAIRANFFLEIPRPDPADNDAYWCFFLPPDACPRPPQNLTIGKPFTYNNNTSRQILVTPYAMGSGFLCDLGSALNNMPFVAVFGRLIEDAQDPNTDYETDVYQPVLVLWMSRAARPEFSPNAIYAQWDWIKA